MKKWLLYLVCLLVIYILVIFCGISYLAHCFLLLPCFIMTLVTYNKLSKTLEKKCRNEFIQDSIYLSMIDLHYLNPLNVYTRKTYSDIECTKSSKLFKIYSLMSLFSFCSMIVSIIIEISSSW